MKLCEYENQTLEAFVAASRSYVQWPARIILLKLPHIKLIAYSWEHLFLLDPSLTRPTAPYCAQRAPFPEYQNTEHDPMNPMKVTSAFLDYSLRMFHF